MDWRKDARFVQGERCVLTATVWIAAGIGEASEEGHISGDKERVPYYLQIYMYIYIYIYIYPANSWLICDIPRLAKELDRETLKIFPICPMNEYIFHD